MNDKDTEQTKTLQQNGGTSVDMYNMLLEFDRLLAGILGVNTYLCFNWVVPTVSFIILESLLSLFLTKFECRAKKPNICMKPRVDGFK